MKKYTFDINELKSIARNNIHMFDDAGCGMYNLALNSDKRLSFRNEGGIIMQLYPYGEDGNACYILNYYEVSKDNYDHADLDFFDDLEDWEQDIVFEMFCERFNIDYNEYFLPYRTIHQELLDIIGCVDNNTLLNLIQSNEELKKIFDANFKKVYTWVASSNDRAFEDYGDFFDTKEECYNNMRDAVLAKMKWNTEFTDFDIPSKELETDPMDKSYEDVRIGYNVQFSPTKITHESYSGIYTYEMKEVFKNKCGNII